MPHRTVILTKIISVTEHFEPRHLSGVGKEATFESVSRGWWVLLEGSHEALYVGMAFPNLFAGRSMRITLEQLDEPPSILVPSLILPNGDSPPLRGSGEATAETLCCEGGSQGPLT